MSKTIYDNHGRPITYLRLSVTDRCNLRCFYCMPEEGIDFLSREDLFSLDQLYELVEIFTDLGIEKVRITGGEPFVVKGLTGFLKRISTFKALRKINITTNGTLLRRFIDDLKQIGINGINLSLDTLDKDRFMMITRRDQFDEVYYTLMKLIEKEFKVKVNCVVMKDRNTEDIIPLVEFTKEHPVSVRFIEEMPFNGSNRYPELEWDYRKIFTHISDRYQEIRKLNDSRHSTSTNYKIPGYQGSFGIIPAFSRTFCGTCNRVRVAASGEMRTCLYGPSVLNLRKLMTKNSKEAVKDKIIRALNSRAKDGYEAEKKAKSVEEPKESMACIGG